MKKISILIFFIISLFISHHVYATQLKYHEKCPNDLILTQNLKAPEIGEKYIRNGSYHWYTKGVVREAKILQRQLNRLGFSAGKVDGIIGPKTKKAILDLQKFLGTKQDGYIGPKTRALLNYSCKEEITEQQVDQLKRNKVKIISPQENNVFKPGDTIHITIKTSPEVDNIVVYAIGKQLGGLSNIEKKEDAPGIWNKKITQRENTFDYVIPQNTIESLLIMVTGNNTHATNPQKRFIGTDTITVNVHSDLHIEKISFDNELIFVPAGRFMPATMYATWSNGEKYFFTDYKNAIYTIEDTSIARYNGNNSIKGIKTGKTKLNVSYQGQTITIPVEVYPFDNL